MATFYVPTLRPHSASGTALYFQDEQGLLWRAPSQDPAAPLCDGCGLRPGRYFFDRSQVDSRSRLVLQRCAECVRLVTYGQWADAREG